MADFSRKYLEKRVRRDFGKENYERALQLVDSYGGKPGEKGGPMVQLACVVEAKGDIEMLRLLIEQARQDYRDALAGLMIKYGNDWHKHV